MFVARIRDMLVKQAAIIQRSKDQDVLSKWRKSGTRTSNKLELSVWPYDTDPVYMSMLTRAELQGPTLDRQRKPVEFKPPINIGEEMTEIFKSLEELDNCRKYSNLSPRTEQQNLNNEIQTVRLQKLILLL
ncbi:hypothetical protein C0J52_11785 [Blattella germanica]|nr:hypothetical protein C0J52_11785 [Blattella germanica]